jgi:hypothetical protein
LLAFKTFLDNLKLITIYSLILYFTNKFEILRSFIIFLVLVFLAGNSYSQINKPEEKKSEWFVRISPHFWFLNLKGEIIRPPSPPIPNNPIETEPRREIDISFGELKSSIKFAFMGSGQYTQNRFITRFDITSLILEGDYLTSLDTVFQDVKGRYEHLSGDIGFGYDILSKPKLNLFLIGGLKIVYMNIGVEFSALGQFPVGGARERWYLDPVIGAQLRYRPIKKLELNAYADVGFFLGDKITSQAIAEVNFFIAQWFYLSGGYRFWYFKVAKEEAIYNGRISGSVIKIGFQIH